MKSNRDVECDNEEQVKNKGKSKITAKKKNKETKSEDVPTQTTSKASTRNPRLSVEMKKKNCKLYMILTFTEYCLW